MPAILSSPHKSGEQQCFKIVDWKHTEQDLHKVWEKMPPIFTQGDSFKAYFWNHLTTLDLSGILNTHL